MLPINTLSYRSVRLFIATGFMFCGWLPLSYSQQALTTKPAPPAGSRTNSSHPDSTSAGFSSSNSSRSYFISLDGLNPKHLRELLEKEQLKAPKGFAYLAKYLSHIEQLTPAYSTITAASHISTATCTPPGVHGIIANSFIRGGQKVSGFYAPFTGTPLWQTLKENKRKVLSIAYVGTDGTAPNRTADYALAYPDDRQVSLPSRHKFSKKAKPTYQPIQITLTPQSGEKLTLYVKLQSTPSGTAVLIDDDRDPKNGVLGTLTRKGSKKEPTDNSGAFVHVYAVEQQKDSPTYGYKRHIFFRILEESDEHVVVYQSGASYNNAYPEAFRHALDAANLVWPNYAIHSDVSAQEKLLFYKQLDEFLAKVAVFAQQKYRPDTVLFYQPLLDTMGHGFENLLPATLLDKKHQPTSPLAQTFIEGYQTIDRNLSEILSSLKQQDVVALMGDHGMQAVTHSINPLVFLPQEAWQHIDLVSNGAMLMLYAKPGHTKQADRIGQQLYESMKKENFQGVSILGTAHRKHNLENFLVHAPGKIPGIYNRQWQFGDAVWAYTAAERLWYVESIEHSQALSPSKAGGMHGHFIGYSSMATTGYIGVLGQKPTTVKQADLIDMVPTFLNLLHLSPAPGCQGKVLPLALAPVDKDR